MQSSVRRLRSDSANEAKTWEAEGDDMRPPQNAETPKAWNKERTNLEKTRLKKLNIKFLLLSFKNFDWS